MKRLYILISFLCLIGAATAQNSNQNYVVTRTMLNESSSSYLDGQAGVLHAGKKYPI